VAATADPGGVGGGTPRPHPQPIQVPWKIVGRPRVDFTDPQLQKCYDSTLGEAGGMADELGQVRALMATHDLFQMLEGPHSSRVHETIERLLRPGMRAGLRRWYQRSDATRDRAAVELRALLSQLAGEQLDPATGVNTP
jgi:hypothetical protein